MSTGEQPKQNVLVDPERFSTNQRVAIYEHVNATLNLLADVQATLDLRPEPAQIYMLIAVSVVQKYMRDPNNIAYNGTVVLPPQLRGSISRRRISDITGIPRETVARHVRNLIERGLVIETGVGKLSTPSGLLIRLNSTGLPHRMIREAGTLTQKLVRLGVLEVAGQESTVEP